MKSHSKPVVCVDAVGNSQGVTAVSSSSDSTVKIWERIGDSGDFSLLQTESYGAGFVLGLSLISLGGCLVLACGTETSKVDIFARHSDQQVCVCVCVCVEFGVESM